jgi:MOSC domain-containing protein YiiM
MRAELVSVNVGVERSGAWTGRMGSSGIDKRPASGRVRAGTLGLAGDVIIDTPTHGGVDQALYAYAREDAEFWAEELDREIPPGHFGENLSTRGLDVTGALIGERWAIGTVIVEVSSPRIPCRTFAGFWGVSDLVKRFTAHGAPGAYLRVLAEGELGAGDRIEIVHRPDHKVTLGESFRALTTEPELIPHVLGAVELPRKRLERLARRLARVQAGLPAEESDDSPAARIG